MVKKEIELTERYKLIFNLSIAIITLIVIGFILCIPAILVPPNQIGPLVGLLPICGFSLIVVLIICAVQLRHEKYKEMFKASFVLLICGIFIIITALIGASIIIHKLKQNKKILISSDNSSEDLSFTNAVCFKCKKNCSLNQMLKTFVSCDEKDKVVYYCKTCANN